ncbi:MFS transporter [Phaeacidiphilus oryzae]|uniref:MFS transporter n=1 Tax=Phaeacidiphilus oryzae TaxID=348818 RepID=UPI000569EDD7|nr:MFS transporter [Phaeacidiphilus oryzae]
MTTTPSTQPQRSAAAAPPPAPRFHYAWIIAAVSLLTLVGAAGFRSTPGLLMDPLHMEFGWSHGTISSAASVNLALYGLTSPFAAALMERFGIRPVLAGALTLIAVGSGLTVFMTASWQLILCWGVLVGLGTGSMAMAFVATVTDRWFAARRGVVTGVLTAAGSAGNLVFLPVLSWLITTYGWRAASLTVGACSLAVVPLVLLLLREHPADLGLAPYGATVPVPRPERTTGAGLRALRVLASAARTRPFWLLAGTFAICGATTNGLVGTHFVPAAGDHGMAETTASGLLALSGLFDVVGTIASGWLTDRFNPRRLLGTYYFLRGCSLAVLPLLFARTVHPSMLVFVIFYGLDWVATVPPTIAIARREYGADAPIVFGWVAAAHQVGAAVVAVAAGFLRDALGDYDPVWYAAGALCVAAAAGALALRERGPATPRTLRRRRA